MSRPKIQGSGFTLLVTQIPILTIVSNLKSQLMKMRFAIKNGFYYIYSKSSVSAKNLKFSNWDLRFEILRRFLHPSSIIHHPSAFSLQLYPALYPVFYPALSLLPLLPLRSFSHHPSAILHLFEHPPSPSPLKGLHLSLVFSPLMGKKTAPPVALTLR